VLLVDTVRPLVVEWVANQLLAGIQKQHDTSMPHIPSLCCTLHTCSIFPPVLHKHASIPFARFAFDGLSVHCPTSGDALMRSIPRTPKIHPTGKRVGTSFPECRTSEILKL